MCVCRHEHSALYSEGPLEWHWWSLEHLWPCVSHPVPAAQGTQLEQWEAEDMTGLQANGTQGCWKPEGSQRSSFIPVVNNFMTSAHTLTPSASDWSLEPETEFTLAWKGERKFASLWRLPKTCGELSQPVSTGGDYYCDPEIKDGVKESWWRSERGEVMDKEHELSIHQRICHTRKQAEPKCRGKCIRIFSPQRNNSQQAWRMKNNPKNRWWGWLEVDDDFQSDSPISIIHHWMKGNPTWNELKHKETKNINSRWENNTVRQEQRYDSEWMQNTEV